MCRMKQKKVKRKDIISLLTFHINPPKNEEALNRNHKFIVRSPFLQTLFLGVSLFRSNPDKIVY